VSLIATLVAYPLAFYVSRYLTRGKTTAALLIIIPLWISLLVRIFAWRVILGEHGVLNSLLICHGIEPSDRSAPNALREVPYVAWRRSLAALASAPPARDSWFGRLPTFDQSLRIFPTVFVETTLVCGVVVAVLAEFRPITPCTG
jgi:ABC-type sugar transport system permease subunit